MRPWFERLAGRFDEELQALKQAGFAFEVDADALKAGHLLLKVKYRLGDKTHDLEVHFPENYPYFPFEISAPTFPDGRHKNPVTGGLCLLKNPLRTWKIEDRLASILTTQVPLVVAANLDPENAVEIEAHEAAQVTGYYTCEPRSVVFTGDWSIPNEIRRGYLLIGLKGDAGPNTPLRAAVLEVQDENRKVVARIDERIRERHQKTFIGRWIRASSPPSFDVSRALSEAAKTWRDIESPRFNGGPDVVGFLVPEEVEYGRFHETWVVTVRQKIREDKPKAQTKMVAYFARPDRLSIEALQARVPNLAPLFDKKILVVGLGSIGSMFAWQLARAGVGGINLLDFDHLQAGNSPRWILGWNVSGHDKAPLLRHYLADQNPFCNVKAWQHRIGTPMTGADHKEAEVIAQALEGVDLVFDATAEWCVSHFLSETCKDLKIPYVWATGTPGAQGGTIGRVVPGGTGGCWKCFQHRLFDKTIAEPNQAETPDVQPAGCFHPTFTGAGFDMDHVTLQAVRLSVSTLCAGHNAYPDFDWDVGILDTWSREGKPMAPEWTTYSLEKHADCEHGA
jgi:molybdopterin/thiamine biosynthesis adenylyltransferase